MKKRNGGLYLHSYLLAHGDIPSDISFVFINRRMFALCKYLIVNKRMRTSWKDFYTVSRTGADMISFVYVWCIEIAVIKFLRKCFYLHKEK